MARTHGLRSVPELIAAGALNAGDQLVIRRRSGPPIEGVLEADGKIRVGVRSYGSPSAAAKAALDVETIDGWLRWRLPRLDYCSLAEVRDGSV